MQRATIVATALAACLTLAGCAEGDGAEGRPATTEEPRSQGFDDYDFGDPVTNERGELVKQVGQWGGFGAPDGSVVGVVRVTDIEPGFVCPQDPSLEPENGQFVALTFEVETSADLGPQPRRVGHHRHHVRAARRPRGRRPGGGRDRRGPRLRG